VGLYEQLLDLAEVRHSPPGALAMAQLMAPAVDPHEAHAGAAGGLLVHGRIVPDVDCLPRRDAQLAQGDLQDARVGLGDATALRGDDRLEQAVQPRGPQPAVLDAGQAVGDQAEPEASAEREEGLAAAGERVGQARDLALVAPREAIGALGVGPGGQQEAAEAFALERRDVDLAAPVALPQRVVDAPVDGQPLGREGQPQAAAGRAQGGALRAGEVEQRVVEVEEDGAERQGYFAR
jgi:hypothetical protein